MKRNTLPLIIERNSQVVALAVAALLASFTCELAAAESPFERAVSRSRFLMGTVCEVVVDGDARWPELAFAEIARVEQLISTWNASSELSRLNRSRDARVSAELYSLLAETKRYAVVTDGAFNPLVGPLVHAWKMRTEGAVPSHAELERIVALLDIDGPSFTSATRRINLPKGAAFEEGAFGKGYALDRAASVLAAATDADFMIDFGGQLMVRSRRPVAVAIANPLRRDDAALLLTLTEGSLSTSSGSEKTFVAGDERFSHIVDPRTGRALPPRGSVSVVSTSALEADILSTALYVMGPAAGLAWADQHDVAAIFIVPSTSGWDVELSSKATNSGLAIHPASAEFKEKDNTR